jgi:hypothetical protein
MVFMHTHTGGKLNYQFINRLNGLFKGATLNLIFILVFALLSGQTLRAEKKYVVNETSASYIRQTIWNSTPGGGDTIFIESSRTEAIKFSELVGEENNPIVVVNLGGQVRIEDPDGWSAIEFVDCKYIKITGSGNSCYKYGFYLSASSCGLAFSGLSTDCEAGFLKISHGGFFGIMAKKDYDGDPPDPIPVFKNLVIHDCFVENVSEGMYLGETKSPGMEFKHVRVFNNIVRNTKRECIQIANMVDDVKVYNNTLLNGGLDDIDQQGSILQVGDNTTATVSNNIMIGASSYGIACYGMGNLYFENNFIRSCYGMFIDNRKYSLTDSIIKISENYFSDITHPDNEVIRNMNTENYLVIEYNIYDDSNALFYRNYSTSYSNYHLNENSVQPISNVLFTNANENDYSLAVTNSEEYMELGAPGGSECLTEYNGDCQECFDALTANDRSIASIPECADGFSCNNPADKILNLKLPVCNDSEFTIEIFSLLGAKLFMKEYSYNSSNKLELDISKCCTKDQIYIVRYYNSRGISKSLKFVKQSI